MNKARFVVVGAGGAQARGMLRALSRVLDLSGVVAVDRRWVPAAKTELERLGVEIRTGDAVGEGRSVLAADGADPALIVNMAGPYYVLGVSMLQCAIDLGADYLDICDDVDTTGHLMALDGAARESGTRALVGMGSAPGTTNVLIRLGVDAVGNPADTTVSLAWLVDRADLTRAALDHAIHCLATAIPGSDGVPGWDELEPRYVDFPDPVGRQLVIRHGHPETLTVPRFLGVRAFTNHGGLVPAEILHVYWSLARQLDASGATGPALDDATYAWYRQFDGFVADRTPRIGSGLQIDITVGGDGYRFASGSEMPMEDATGIPAAAGVLLMLDEVLPEPGVVAPECLDPQAFFDKVRQVSTGGGGLQLFRLENGRATDRVRIRDLLGARRG